MDLLYLADLWVPVTLLRAHLQELEKVKKKQLSALIWFTVWNHNKSLYLIWQWSLILYKQICKVCYLGWWSRRSATFRIQQDLWLKECSFKHKLRSIDNICGILLITKEQDFVSSHTKKQKCDDGNPRIKKILSFCWGLSWFKKGLRASPGGPEGPGGPGKPRLPGKPSEPYVSRPGFPFSPLNPRLPGGPGLAGRPEHPIKTQSQCYNRHLEIKIRNKWNKLQTSVVPVSNEGNPGGPGGPGSPGKPWSPIRPG